MLNEHGGVKKITPYNQIQVVSSDQSPHHKNKQFSGQQKKRDEKLHKKIHQEKNLLHDISPNHVFYNIELGNLLIKKRNIELLMFMQLSHEGEISKNEKIELEKIKTQILNLQTKINNLEEDDSEEEIISPQVKLSKIIDQNIVYLEQLLKLYDQHFRITQNEHKSIISEDLKLLSEIMKLKNGTIEHIEAIQSQLDLKQFSKLEDNSEKKSKANSILSDIHTRIDQIITQEDENSAELKNQQDELRNQLGKHDKSTKVISQYKSHETKSHFIDTTK